MGQSSIGQVIIKQSKGAWVRSILLKVKTLLLQRCALCIKFHVTEGHMCVIRLCSVHSIQS